MNKYWHQRTRLLSKGTITPSPSFKVKVKGEETEVEFDLDDRDIAERWYSVSPEIISRAMSGYLVHLCKVRREEEGRSDSDNGTITNKLLLVAPALTPPSQQQSPPSPPSPSSPPPLPIYVDPFCGVGQDTISLSKSLTSPPTPHLILTCDMDLNCLLTTSKNLALHNVSRDTVALVWCNSLALLSEITTNFDCSLPPTCTTSEGYKMFKLGPSPLTTSCKNHKSIWSGIPEVSLSPGVSNVLEGVFLSPPWNNTGYYDNGSCGSGVKFSLSSHVRLTSVSGAAVDGVDVVRGWRDKVKKGGWVCAFVPNTWDEVWEDEGNREVYGHVLNGKHKTSAFYVSR